MNIMNAYINQMMYLMSVPFLESYSSNRLRTTLYQVVPGISSPIGLDCHTSNRKA